MPVVRFLQWFALFLLAAFALAAVPAGAQTVGSPIPAGTNPRAIAIDPVLNKAYIVSELTDQVIALDGATNATTAIATGSRPQFIAVNPTTHRVYVTNANDATMTEIDGTTNTVVNTLGVGGNGPIAINPITNRIFMVRLSSPATDEVTIVDGNTDTWFSIALDSFQPDAIALNPVTNKVYVATYATGDVRIVDGNTVEDFPHPPAVGVFSHPVALAVNPVTDRTYVVTEDSRGPFGYIDGSDNYTLFTAPGHAASPKAVAVNVVTNKIYAAFDGEVMVMDGATDAFTFIPSGTAGAGPVAIGVNPTTNKIYVPNANGTLTVIDGATNATTTLTIPAGATSIGVNPVTNAMYVTAPDSVSVVTGAATDTVQSIPLTASITPLPGDQGDANPTLTINAASGFSPVAPPVWRVYYQLDGTTGTWTPASGSGPYTASFTGLSAGSHTLHAFATDTQEGPTVNTGPQSVPLVGNIVSYTFTVGAQNAAVALASSANPSSAGQSVTFTATVTDNGAGSAPTGTATFRDGASVIAGCTSVAIASGTAQCTTGALAAGTHSIVAAYSGDSNHAAANSSALSQTVNAATASVSLAATPNPSNAGQTITLTATLSGGAGPVTGSVNFRDGSTSISGCGAISISANQATCTTSALASGSHTLSASYSGDAMYAAASSNTVTQTVNGTLATTTVSLASSANPSTVGQGVTFTASVSGSAGTPTGSVTFRDGSTAICTSVALSSGAATCATSTLTQGTHSITASYSGDASYAAGTSSAVSQAVNAASGGATPTFAFGSNINPSTAGQVVTFTANLSGTAGVPTGTVAFLDNGTPIDGCEARGLTNGSTNCSTSALAAGSHSITARYSGDGSYAPATSSTIAQVVNPPSLATATVALSSSVNPSTTGQAVTFTASVSGSSGTPTGSVSFLDGGSAISGCSAVALSSGAATCATSALSAGTHSITATYSGDGTYAAATSTATSQVVQPASSGGPSVNAAAASAGATVVASSTLGSRYPATAINDGDRKGTGFGSGGIWEDGTSYSFPDWVQIDFNGAQTIDHVIVYSMQDNYSSPVEPSDTMTFRAYGITAFDVQAWNGSAWSTVASVSGNNLVKRTASFAPVTTGRIRILVVAALNGFSRIAEVEAWTAGGSGGGTLANASIAIASSVNPSQAGDMVTFTTQVTGSAGTPTGTVGFLDGGSAISGCSSVTLSSGMATCATASLSAGSHSITVSYGGDGSYNAGTSSAFTQTVQSGSGGGTSENVAAASAGATVSASSTLSSRYPVSAINDGDRTGAGFGNGGIWEDANPYTFPDWVQVRFDGTQTIDHVIVYSMQDGYTSPVEPSDTMTFRSYGVTAFDVQVWNGSAWVTVGSVTGNNLVKRTVSFAPVATDRMRVVVNNALNGYSRLAEVEAWSVGGSGGGGTGGAASASIAIASSANPSTAGQAVTFTATLTGGAGTPTGTVDFLDGGSAIAACANVALSSGAATCTTSALSAGSHSISVSYGGDASYIASTSSAFTQTVQSAGGGTDVNVAAASAGATASASSTLSTRYPVSAINDGDRSGAGFGNGGIWEDANAYTFPDWVQIAFGGAKTIDHVIVYSMQDAYTTPVDPSDTMTFRSYGVTDFLVQGWDGSQWVTLGAVSDNNLVKRTVSFPAYTTDRIRVVVTNANAGYSRLAEVEAFGH